MAEMEGDHHAASTSEGSMETGEEEDEESLQHENEEEADEDEDLEDATPAGIFSWLLGRRETAVNSRVLASKYRRLEDVVVLPLKGDLAQEVNLNTSGINIRRPCSAPSLDRGIDTGSRRVKHPWPRVFGVQEGSNMQPPSIMASAAAAELEQETPSSSSIPAPGTARAQGQPSDVGPHTDSHSRDAGRQQQQLQCLDGGGASTSDCMGEEKGAARGAKGSGILGALRRSTRLGAQKEKQEAAQTDASTSAGTGPGSDAQGEPGPSSQQKHHQQHQQRASKNPLISSPLPSDASGWVLPNTTRMLCKWECGLGDSSGCGRSSRRYFQCQPDNLPTKPARQVDELDSRAYIGQFSNMDGRFFVAAYQDQRVRLYDVEKDWELRKDVRARGIRWTITDTCLSPDQRFLLYSSISPTVHLLALGGSWDVVESLANVTEIHEALEFDPENQSPYRFGIWSLAWSGDGKEIIAGTNNESVYIFDLAMSTVTAKVTKHKDDVNAVAYLDSTPNLILSGSDDSHIKLWDRRMIGHEEGCRNKPVGTMVGHTEGITHLDSRGDGRHFISNSKDQCVKLWDTRMSMRSELEVASLPTSGIPRFNWDYRWMDYPGHGYDIRHPHDASLMTYRGHQVHQTLIRAYFSPAFTTGQRFIYAGSANGCIYMWDVVTGKVVHVLDHHGGLVRDMNWHPYEPKLGSVSWDGVAMEWEPPNMTRPK